jgi:preprotein translocase subunit YajC
MIVSPAFAQTGAPGGLVQFDMLLPLLLMLITMYFFLFRPQQQKMKAHREMIANVRRGDTVVTSGGIIGKVTKVKDDTTVEVEIADNTRVQLVRQTIAEVRSKGEPVKDGDKA